MSTAPTKAVAARELASVGLAPRGLSREQAAAYVGVSVSLFDAMVADGRMPQAKRINARLIWDRVRLDSYFEKIPDGADRDESDVWSTAAV